jgi:cell division protein FtsW (lipid II flippase)
MKTKTIDYKLFFTVFALIVFGMIMISSVSVYPSFQVTSKMLAAGKTDEVSNSFYLTRNIMHVAITLLVFVFVAKTPYKLFEKYAKQIFLGSLIFMVIVLIA